MIINNAVYLAIIISIAAAIFGQYFIKKLASRESLGRALNIIFFFCAVLAGLTSLSFGPGLKINIFIISLGVMNAWVAWLWWRAIGRLAWLIYPSYFGKRPKNSFAPKRTQA